MIDAWDLESAFIKYDQCNNGHYGSSAKHFCTPCRHGSSARTPNTPSTTYLACGFKKIRLKMKNISTSKLSYSSSLTSSLRESNQAWTSGESFKLFGTIPAIFTHMLAKLTRTALGAMVTNSAPYIKLHA